MTIQKKQFISLDDILSLVLECECGATMVSPIEKFKGLPKVCHNCGGAIMEAHESTKRQLEEIITSVENLKGTSGLRFKLRLEITPVCED
jgi:hypothetical protein